MKHALLALTAAVLLVLTPAMVAADPPPPPKLDAAAVTQANTAFALDLYAQLRAGKGNLFFSPHSISTAVAITYDGARGQTQTQMAKTLHVPDDPPGVAAGFAELNVKMRWTKEWLQPYQLDIANSLWGQKDYPFSPEFLAVLAKQYGAPLQQISFANPANAAKSINNWVEQRTHEKIKDLLAPGLLDEATRLVLVNAVYFKASWQQTFIKSMTKEQPFTAWVDGAPRQVKAPLMSREASFDYFEEPDLQVVELPYEGNDLSMVVFLPNLHLVKPEAAGPADRFAAFEQSLTPETLAGWLGKLKREVVIVELPKFKVTGSFVLNDTLKAMGMGDAFDPKEANFSGMNDGKERLYLSCAIHKSFVNVDEQGTEAAAATALPAAGADGFPPERIKHFRADHPFVLLIRHRPTGSILFMGRVVDPTAN